MRPTLTELGAESGFKTLWCAVCNSYSVYIAFLFHSKNFSPQMTRALYPWPNVVLHSSSIDQTHWTWQLRISICYDWSGSLSGTHSYMYYLLMVLCFLNNVLIQPLFLVCVGWSLWFFTGCSFEDIAKWDLNSSNYPFFFNWWVISTATTSCISFWNT